MRTEVERDNVFSLLDPRIVEMLHRRGITEPTPPQQQSISRIMSGENVLLISPTGSGKTEAAILPVFHHILSEHPPQVSTLLVTPLRALNRDILDRLRSYSSELGLRVQVRHSDISIAQRKEITNHPADILITTPESLQLMLNGKNLRKIISNVKYLIVDELHEVSQSERGSQLAVALERLRSLAGNFQRIGLSATIGNSEELLKFLVPSGNGTVVTGEIKKRMEIASLIPAKSDQKSAEIMGCDDQYAGSILYIWNQISTHNGTLVFVNTRSVAEDMAFRLRLLLEDPPIEVHHGSLSRETREAAEQSFKRGELKALICTSSLELGIDIGTADLVIQFNSPRQINRLIQRVGRSGHSLEKISFGKVVCSDIIELEEANAIIAQAADERMEDISIRKGSLATLANQIMMELKFSGTSNIEELFNLFRSSYPYRDLRMEEFQELCSFLESTGKVWINGGKIGRKRGVLNYFIENISMIPNEKNYKVIDQINRKFIGTLDERYVVNEIEPGSYFVIKGSTWRTIRIDGERILVEPFPTAAIAPKWSGEEIPVLPDVAERVSLHREQKFIPTYLDQQSRQVLTEWYEKVRSTEKNLVIEAKANEVVIQSLLGTKANFALAEIFSGILSGITGESVEADYSPYHVYARAGRKISANDARRILLSIDPAKLEAYISGAARRSRFFNSVFLYEAKKFGVVSNDSDMGRIRMEKLIDAYYGTVLYKDSVRKLISDYMDLDTLRSFLEGIRNN
ncbi:MAG: DEAD/DEAH box helicase, partial [Thermoplasmataceae archaeon]